MQFRVGCFDNAIDSLYPPFLRLSDVSYSPGLPTTSFARQFKFRPSNYVIRTFSPSGRTEHGLYVTKNEKFPRVWAHVLACGKDNPHRIRAGDLIVFTRNTQEFVGEDNPRSPEYPGETLPVEIVNFKAITAIIENPPVTVRF